MTERLVAAVSGGVDSAVTAARLVADGHDVTAVHLVLHDAAGGATSASVEAARGVASALGLPFEVWDMREQFSRLVLDDFAGVYAAGLTPNPCLRCNKTIKFGALLDRALASGFDGVATGHYARLVRGDGGVELRRAVDLAKDQSYVLSILTSQQLGRAWFPLGVSMKADVQAEAARLGLPVADSESMDLCFIPDGDVGSWLRGRLGNRPGDIVDETGAVLGRHDGTYGFTVGQRKGLNVRVPAVDGHPRFVLGVDAGARHVIVGPRERLAVDVLACQDAVWTSGVVPDGPLAVQTQVRAHGDEHDAIVEARPGGEVEVRLLSPIVGVAPGQTAAFYDGDRVVGSATIRATRCLRS